MRFTQEMIEAIVENRKSQTRRLVNKGEEFNTESGHGPVNAVVNRLSERVKWRVGQDYAVQDESGKAIWWCPKCKQLLTIKPVKNSLTKTEELSCQCHKGVRSHPKFRYNKTTKKWLPKHFGWQLLRFRIKKICQERLLDITEENAKAEGFKKISKDRTCRDEFLNYFWKLFDLWEEKKNPLVWAISFKVVV